MVIEDCTSLSDVNHSRYKWGVRVGIQHDLGEWFKTAEINETK